MANEDLFGPYSSIFFALADHEVTVLIDKENGLEIREMELSLDINFDGKEINPGLDL